MARNEHETEQPSRFGLFLARHRSALAVGVPVFAIILAGFRSSWPALRDSALASHMDPGGADLYPFAVDGLIAVAIVALLLLRDKPGPRAYCLFVIVSYTVASWLLNYLHGLGMFAPDPTTGEPPNPPWWVVGVVASLVIGSIGLGSHLLVLVLRHSASTPPPARKPRTAAPPKARASKAEKPAPSGDESEGRRKAAAECLTAPRIGVPLLGQKALGKKHGISSRQAGYAQDDARREFTAASNGSPQ